ncbi:MAG: DNA replication/repair protein RecF [Candidatus Dojkabacteria bacterium]
MHISNIAYKNFRNLNLKARIAPGLNIIVAPNGAGKSNFLDGIHYLSYVKSFRKYLDGSNISLDKKSDFARIDAELVSIDPVKLTIIFSSQEGRNFKRYEVNGISKRKTTFSGNLYAVLFAPHDLDLISGSPEVRRGELDDFINSFDIEFAATLKEYKAVVKQRNKLLARIAEGVAKKGELGYWNDKLIDLGSKVITTRIETLERFLPVLAETARELFNGELNDLSLGYISKFGEIGGKGEKDDDYRSKVARRLRQKIEENSFKEIAATKTLYGPHRDDIDITLAGRPVKIFGSRGQQRLAALIFKLAMLVYLEELFNEKLILLLDDVMSELDQKHRENLERILSKMENQIIITGTSTADYTDGFLKRGKRIKLGDS